MTGAIRYLQFVTTVSLAIAVVNIFWAHNERAKMVDALYTHQAHTIAAFAAVNQLIANGISRRIDQQAEKNDVIMEQNLAPTPTPQVIHEKGKTKYRTRYVHPTPKPFHLFGP